MQMVLGEPCERVFQPYQIMTYKLRSDVQDPGISH